MRGKAIYQVGCGKRGKNWMISGETAGEKKQTQHAQATKKQWYNAGIVNGKMVS